MPKNYLKRFNFNNLPGIVVGELKLLVTTLFKLDLFIEIFWVYNLSILHVLCMYNCDYF